jgi:3-keto-disaccharide hydrolase
MPECRGLLICLSATFVMGAAAAFGKDLLPPESVPPEAVPVPMAVFNFDRDPLGKPPPRFTLAVTGQGSGIHWEVVRARHAPSAPNILVQNGTAKPGENFALALLDDVRLDHGEVAVRFKALSGEEDQAAGIVFRYKDPQNYYVIVANAREDTCALYRVKNGKRKPLDSKDVIVTPFVWHELRITFAKGTYTALVDRQLILGGKDSSFTAAGFVGLWTKSDSQIAFDDFRVSK